MGELSLVLQPVTTTLYVDLSARQALSPKYAEPLNALPVDGLAIMVQSSRGKFTYSDEQVLQLREVYPLKRLTLVGWPRVSSAGKDARELKRLCDLIKAEPEVDLEGNFKGTTAKRKAAALEIIEALGAKSFVSTTFPFHSENGETAVVAPAARLNSVQTYATTPRNKKVVLLTDQLGPARIHELKVSSYGNPIGLAFPLYGQNFVGSTPEETLSVQVARGLVAHNPADVRFWSAKHLFRESNKYALPFLRDTYPQILAEYRQTLITKWASWLVFRSV